jgi:phenylalanyl-tRNA synthetase alpha chain
MSSVAQYTVPKLDNFTPARLAEAAKELISACEAEATAVRTDADYKSFRDRWMARKNGILTQINEGWLQAAPKEGKREVGARVNEIKNTVEQIVEGVQQRLASHTSKADVTAGRVDVTLPGLRRTVGVEHPVIRTMNQMVGIFKAMGYSVDVGPEIETDYYNFEALNFPPNHPARDTQDTIFITGQEQKPQRDRLLLRTHTSPVQIRAMEKQQPPVRIVIPGKVHRNDEADATHSPVFHQIEGLCVDTNITFCDLKGSLDHAMKSFFGTKTKTRFQPSFFPFTEPSAEVAVTCFKCGGSGQLSASEPCRLCKTSGWIELLGCGMVDPNVYGFVGYDAKRLSGFAFGMGVERLTMALYDIDDIQLFFSGDVRFLEQFA